MFGQLRSLGAVGFGASPQKRHAAGPFVFVHDIRGALKQNEMNHFHVAADEEDDVEASLGAGGLAFIHERDPGDGGPNPFA
ncbi:hypothetical protein D3C72_2357900 [compost metagenome]